MIKDGYHKKIDCDICNQRIKYRIKEFAGGFAVLIGIIGGIAGLAIKFLAGAVIGFLLGCGAGWILGYILAYIFYDFSYLFAPYCSDEKDAKWLMEKEEKEANDKKREEEAKEKQEIDSLEKENEELKDKIENRFKNYFDDDYFKILAFYKCLSEFPVKGFMTNYKYDLNAIKDQSIEGDPYKEKLYNNPRDVYDFAKVHDIYLKMTYKNKTLVVAFENDGSDDKPHLYIYAICLENDDDLSDKETYEQENELMKIMLSDFNNLASELDRIYRKY